LLGVDLSAGSPFLIGARPTADFLRQGICALC
jgi:hypothetical protein